MNDILKRYKLNNEKDKLNALKEIMQETILCGLYRTDFFKHNAFYGGTALRIFYNLDRFSEDLDFCITDDTIKDYSIYHNAIINELASLGIKANIRSKQKSLDTRVKSFFIEANLIDAFSAIFNEEIRFNKNELVKIKLEIDQTLFKHFNTEYKYRLFVSPYQVRVLDEPSLFSGKLHAVLARNWKTRIKGRDLYDYIFYLKNNAKVNLDYLKEKLVESDTINPNDDFNINILKELLINRFKDIDYNSAKEDVYNFIDNPKDLDIWSSDFFIQITDILSK